MLYDNFRPPLRIVLNSECNGRCDFCHQEGNTSQSSLSMEVLNECIAAINKLGIKNVSLTGGEPTLSKELPQVINLISEECKDTRLSLTTNGFKLCEIIPQIKYTIYGINLSIVSFDPAVAAAYQNVDPREAIRGLNQFQALNKTINVMILERNYQEIDEFIAFCSENGYNLDIMFLDKHEPQYRFVQKNILQKIIKMGDMQILLQSTPVIRIMISGKNYIRIKHPSLSRLLRREICEGCSKKEECFERVCAVRVYGNGLVSPCLSNIIQEQKEASVMDKIEATYNRLDAISGIYDFAL